MLQSEFERLSGYQPTIEEYREIESLYYEFDGDKRAFCKTWKKLFGFKVKTQQEERAEKQAREQKRWEACKRFDTILSYGGDGEAHARARVGMMILKGIYIMRKAKYPTYYAQFDKAEKKVLREMQIQLGYPDDLRVTACADLHEVAFTEAIAPELLDYILWATEDDYLYAKSWVA